MQRRGDPVGYRVGKSPVPETVGFRVKGEVNGCDVVAVHDEEPQRLAIVEMKRRLQPRYEESSLFYSTPVGGESGIAIARVELQ